MRKSVADIPGCLVFDWIVAFWGDFAFAKHAFWEIYSHENYRTLMMCFCCFWRGRISPGALERAIESVSSRFLPNFARSGKLLFQSSLEETSGFWGRDLSLLKKSCENLS